MNELATFAHGNRSELKKACLAACDRRSENQGQQLLLSDSLASFVDQFIADGVAKDATSVVMLT